MHYIPSIMVTNACSAHSKLNGALYVQEVHLIVYLLYLNGQISWTYSMCVYRMYLSIGEMGSPKATACYKTRVKMVCEMKNNHYWLISCLAINECWIFGLSHILNLKVGFSLYLNHD